MKVDLGVGMGGAVAREYGVSATPTFEFFLDRKKVRGSTFAFSNQREDNDQDGFACVGA